MIERLAAVPLGTLLITFALTWVIGPIRLLASFAVLVTWAIIPAIVLAGWLALRLHGGIETG
jgi:hypothetical protein